MHGVLPAMQRLARELLRRLADAKVDARVVSGTRSYTEQDALFQQGRTTPGDIVTWARAGQSLHNFAIAVDLGIWRSGHFLEGKTDEEIALYDRAGEVGKAIVGLEWGGDWTGKKKDRPHWQLRTGLTLPELRRRFEKGERLVA